MTMQRPMQRRSCYYRLHATALACAYLTTPLNAFITAPSSQSAHTTISPLHSSIAEPTSTIINQYSANNNNNNNTPQKKKIALLLCPAQFCVPADYTTLLSSIASSPHLPPNTTVIASKVAPLPRTEWIKVAKQLPTTKFFNAELDVRDTLDWYFDAMESGLAELFAECTNRGEEEDVQICLVGHSIGGWVARAYLGGMSGSSTAIHRLANERITSLITLGTPHTSPPSAIVDQTRGLLRQIESTPSCSSQSLTDRGIRITCVSSSGLRGNILTAEVESLVAASSYYPLTGTYNTRGDGIVPTELAFMEHPAKHLEVRECALTKGVVRHAHVLPTPWNLVDGSAPSWSLPEEFVWYGSEGVLSQWLPFL